MELLVIVANIACWGVIVVVWLVAAVRDAGDRQRQRVRGSTEIRTVALALVGVATIVFVGRWLLAPLTVEAPWARMIGAAVLVGSTLFAIWARLTLGRSWSVAPQAVMDRGIRTDGPYAITRHPIYTGLLGMLLGSALLGGLGQSMVVIVTGLFVFGLKIRSEERLLLATFPEAYATYRDQVPQLIPTWRSVFRERRPIR